MALASVGWVTSLVQKAEASMERINDFMEAEPLIQSPAATAQPLNCIGITGV